MAFIKKFGMKDMSLPSLIDCMFLLNVFSLVTIPISNSSVESGGQGNRNVDMALPVVMSSTTEKLDLVFKTLLFEIENQDPKNPSSNKVLFVLKPSVRDSLTLPQAKRIAIRDSLFSTFPANFLDMSDPEFIKLRACKMICDEIRRYKKNNFFKPVFSNSIEVRAVKNTEFRIVNYIMEQCSVYGDTIPRVILRTLSGREMGRGF